MKCLECKEGEILVRVSLTTKTDLHALISGAGSSDVGELTTELLEMQPVHAERSWNGLEVSFRCSHCEKEWATLDELLQEFIDEAADEGYRSAGACPKCGQPFATHNPDGSCKE
jgi:DNA-directed RNA polymerase subunit RPC12/RpoP